MSLIRRLLCLAVASCVLPVNAASTNWHHIQQSHEYSLNDTDYSYQAYFNELMLSESASVSATSYVIDSAAKRPVLFAFNGGPGASSSPLHFNGIGPWNKEKNASGEETFTRNPATALKYADLVFIDPPGTGFSLPSETPRDHANVWTPEGDAQTVHRFITAWLKQHNREDAPVYLAGESYGGFRLATLLGQPVSYDLRGILLISPMLDASATEVAGGNILPYILNLPSFAVAAVQHGLVESHGLSSREVFNRAKAFALSEYAQALLMGAALPEAQARAVASKMAGYLGLSAATIVAHDLKIDSEYFRLNALKAQGQQFGRLDARVLAPIPKKDNDKPSALSDPSLGLGKSLIMRSDAITNYMQQALGVERSTPYAALSLEVNRQWQYGKQGSPWEGPNFYFNPTPNIAAQLSQRPNFKVVVLTGYFDLAVPALAPWYALTQSGIAPQQVQYEMINSGHSVFAEQAEQARLETIMQELLQP
ncbi:S10 family serine carboxypeptidase-like protein [Alteromonas gilva]|uniref:Peptidase S10 n=1 Tax=Alteromonas gilva TaxID=2987522 RepID=A0ABT5L4C6_9ALTE|nr:hypothetical protein [Alteromonas gilva]MDC8831901.1 hypothetical protein [Alteromonas gilva]